MQTEKIIYFVRHGQSADNAASVFQSPDSPLSEKGHKMAERVADGENFGDIITRADKALAFLVDRIEKSIVVVTHGYFLRTIIARVLLGNLLSGEAHRRFQKGAEMQNTGLTVLKYQGMPEENFFWHLWVYNDHAHLG